MGAEFKGVLLSSPETVPRKMLYPTTPIVALGVHCKTTVCTPAAPEAVPERFTPCGLPVALSVKLNTAERVATGAKLMLMVQLAPAAKLVPQLLVWENSPAFTPPIDIPVIVNGAFAGVCHRHYLRRT